MIRVIATATLMAVLLSGCAGKVHDRPGQKVGDTKGDTVEIIPAVVHDVATTVISIVRTYDEGGMLALCGAVVIAAPNAGVAAEIDSYFVDMNSDLMVGATQPVQVAPRFMRRHIRIVPSGMLELKNVNTKELEGNCVVTESAWRAEFLSSNKLNLRKTTYTYMPVYRR